MLSDITDVKTSVSKYGVQEISMRLKHKGVMTHMSFEQGVKNMIASPFISYILP